MTVVACRADCPGSVAYEWTKESRVSKFWGSVEISGRKEGQKTGFYHEGEYPELTRKLRPLHQGYISRETSIVVELQARTLAPMRWDSGFEGSELCIAMWEEGDKEWRQMDPAKVTLIRNCDNAEIQRITISCNRCIQNALETFLKALSAEFPATLVNEYLCWSAKGERE